MPPIPCPLDVVLMRMLDDDLDGPEAEAVEAHIAACPECQGKLEVLTQDSGADAPRDAPDPGSADADFVDRLARRPPAEPLPMARPESTWETGQTPEPRVPLSRPPEIPGYEILEVLGRGGMGVVYRARAARLKRIVALKMLLQGGHASSEEVARFRSEAETVARLQHPNVVRIHAVGDHDGRPFIEMEYVEGGSLAARLDGTPRSPLDAARSLEAMARGVAEIHRLGVVHRDLKPGNILMAADETPKIGDFGLAKSLDLDSGLTQPGAVMGSPCYMAPEQAKGFGHAAGTLVDVYALGAILYELLTGRPPFRAATVPETLQQVQTVEPVAPSRLAPGVPRDLETIALKCLEKAPARRYPSAIDLAEDLRRFLDGRPILARPVGPAGHLVRWCRRQPWIAGLGAAVFILVLVVAGVTVAALARVLAAAEQERRTIYFARMNLAQLAWEDADTRRMSDLLAPYETDSGPGDLRGFEWYYWWRLAHLPAAEFAGHRHSVLAVAISPDGRTIASAGRDRVVILWDRASHEVEATFPSPARVRALAFTPDGRAVVAGTANGHMLIQDRAAGSRPALLSDGPGPVMALGFIGPRSLVVAREPNVSQVWDLDTKTAGKATRGSRLSAGRIEDLDNPGPQAISADGRLLAAAGLDGTVLVRTTSGSPSEEFEVKFRAGARSDWKPARSLAFSPDGRILAIGLEDRTVVLWDLERREALHTLREHVGPVWSLAFSPDGQALASGGYDNIVALWDVASGRLESTLKGHGGPINAVAFSPDGRILISSSNDATVKLWDLDARESGAGFPGHSGGVNAVAYAPDGATLATAGRDGRIILRSVETGKRLEGPGGLSADGPPHHPSQIRAMVYTPDGKVLVTAGWKCGVRLWDARTLAMVREIPLEEENSVESLAISPDGSTLAAGLRSNRILFWDFGRWSRRVANGGGDAMTTAIAFSRDGRQLASACKGESIAVWDVASATLLRSIISDRSRAQSLAFSPDGTTLAAGESDGTLSLWEFDSGKSLARQPAHANEITSLGFTSDGRTLATAGRDGAIRLWDVAARQLKSSLKGHTDNVMSVAFARDGQTLASGSLDGTARLWRAARSAEIPRP